MGSLVSINGHRCSPSDAKISVFDRGFLYGDSVYEVIRSYQGRPFELVAHLERLEDSARRIGLELPWTLDGLAEEISGVLVASGNPADEVESYLRVMVTRGSGEVGLDPDLASAPCTIVICKELAQSPAELYSKGVNVALLAPLTPSTPSLTGTTREASYHSQVDPRAKTGNYLPNVLAMAKAKAQGAFEAMRVGPGGELTEGSSSNLFVVEQAAIPPGRETQAAPGPGRLLTPPLEAGILEGVTRRTVIRCARELGVAFEECRLLPAQLRGASEAFLTSSVREIVPITRVDGDRIGDGEVGAVTKTIQQAFRAYTGQPFGVPRF